ncbi:thioredoxin, partial [Enterococcus faecium]
EKVVLPDGEITQIFMRKKK